MAKTTTKQMKKVTVDLPAHVLAALDFAAKKNGRTRAGELRFFLSTLVLPGNTVKAN